MRARASSNPFHVLRRRNRSYVPRHCDPRQSDYDARNIAWAVGDLLSIAASTLVLTAFGYSDELHPIGARMPVTWLCICDILYHTSDVMMSVILLAASDDTNMCGAVGAIMMQLLQPGM